MEGERPVPRGRGAALLEALKKREQREREAAVGLAQQEQPEEPPKPRGRAALLARLQESRAKKVGAEPPATTGSTFVSPLKPVVSAPVKSTVEEMTKAVEDLSVKEIVHYRGEMGRHLKVSANYIRLNVQKDRGVYEYEVKFDPDLDAKNRRIKMVNILMKEMGSVKVFDGGNVLYLPQKIIETEKVFCENLPGVDGDQQITTTLIYKRKKRMGECLHLYNVLFKRIMHVLLYTQMGRNYFNPQHKHLIPQHKLEVLPGFAVTVDEMEDGLMLCMDTQHRVLRTQNAYELLQELRCSQPREFKDQARANIIGSCVFTRYNNRTYVVDDIAWEMSPKDTFTTRDGGEISFTDYYMQQYNIKINDVGQPLLIHRKSIRVPGCSEKQDRMVCLVPELCFLTGLTETMRNDFKVMKDVAMYTRVTPHQRMQALRTYLDNVNKSERAQQILGDWGLTIAGGTVDMHARQFENEEVWFGGDKRIRTNNNADWNRAVGENQVTGPVDMVNWIVFHTQRDNRNANEFAKTMTRMGDVMGCRISQPKMVQLPDDRNETYVQLIKSHVENSKVQIVVFICPSMRTDRYNIIKHICCTQHPVASQVINSKTLANPAKVRAIIQKIALQMTCKLGGTLWTVRFPFKNWMICGIDVYHSTTTQSVCAFVSSLNETISRWFNFAVYQEKELGDYFKVGFTKALEKFRNENGNFPSKIVIFRDGVSDAQLEQCRRYEIEQFLSVLRQFSPETTLCFVVVQKRISTRIFSVDSQGHQNPPPGTVLDHTVSKTYMKDFYLVSQNVRQGTVNPTHYVVVYDGCNLKPDHVQRLAYKLCHLYYNWPGTIRVPAPCQYAHKLAAQVGQNIRALPSVQLCDKLFYL